MTAYRIVCQISVAVITVIPARRKKRNLAQSGEEGGGEIKDNENVEREFQKQSEDEI